VTAITVHSSSKLNYPLSVGQRNHEDVEQVELMSDVLFRIRRFLGKGPGVRSSVQSKKKSSRKERI
jgi:hypothetical protein